MKGTIACYSHLLVKINTVRIPPTLTFVFVHLLLAVEDVDAARDVIVENNVIRSLTRYIAAYRNCDSTLSSYLSASLCTAGTLLSSSQKLLKILKRNLISSGERSFGFIIQFHHLQSRIRPFTSLRNLPTLSSTPSP